MDYHGIDFGAIDREKEAKTEEFMRLAIDPSMLVPLVGDHVLIAAGLIGRGLLWEREECEVIEIADTAVKVRGKNFGRPGKWEEWIHNRLITDVLKRSDE